jgi:hypothetical protein
VVLEVEVEILHQVKELVEVVLVDIELQDMDPLLYKDHH